jgi:5-methylcytosine-specific restriction endonuclease McrA
MEWQDNMCALCLREVEVGLPDGSPNLATLDHIVPISRGGPNSLDNLRILCWPCNQDRADEDVEDTIRDDVSS